MSIPEQPAAEQAHGERPGWPILQQPPGFVVYMGLLVFAVLFLIGVAAALTTLTTSDVVTFAALTLCAAVSVEGVRRLGQPRGLSHDLLGAWWFPVVVLLPPIYALLVPLPVFVLMQCRVRRARVHRRVFNACSIALCGFLASVLWHGVHAGDPIAGLGGSAGSAASLLTVGGVLLAVLCCMAFTGLNTALIALAARISNGPERVRRTNADREAVMVDAVELCVGITVAILAQLSLLLLAIALPPILLLQRSLMYHQLRAAARTDPKTGLLNAPTWEQAAVNAIARARSTRGRAAVLIIDIDHFKRVNDSHGHLFGDQVLLGVATTIDQQLRQSDLLGRFGGEEFVVLLPGADVGEASRAAERLRARVGGMEITVDDVPVAITVSVGLAVTGEHGNDLVELLTAADLALYRAKETGRNRVCLPAGGPGPTGDSVGEPEGKGEPGSVGGPGVVGTSTDHPGSVELRGVQTCPAGCGTQGAGPVGDAGSGEGPAPSVHPAHGHDASMHRAAEHRAADRSTARHEGHTGPVGRIPGPREGGVPEAVVAEVAVDAVAGAAASAVAEPSVTPGAPPRVPGGERTEPPAPRASVGPSPSVGEPRSDLSEQATGADADIRGAASDGAATGDPVRCPVGDPAGDVADAGPSGHVRDAQGLRDAGDAGVPAGEIP